MKYPREECKRGHKITETSHYYYAKRNQFMCKKCKRDTEKRTVERIKLKSEREKQRTQYFGTE